MLILATPSTGYAVAYDLDNIMKQKDPNGVLSPIGGSQDLRTVLSYGNNTATYSIVMGTYSEINSFAGGKIKLSDGGTQSVLVYVNSTSGTSSINLKPDSVSLFNKFLDNSTQISIGGIYSQITSTESNGHIISTNIENDYNTWSLKFRDNSLANEYVNVIEAKNVSDIIDGTAKASLHLNSKNSITNIGVKNSVIIGGSGLTASQSNTVYLANVNINNSYNLPLSDGSADQIIKTDGSGNLEWVDLNNFVVGLDSVLNTSNSTGLNDIQVNDGYSIKSLLNSSILTLDYQESNNILLSNSNSVINLTPGGQINITTNDGNGIKYSSDYSQNFTPESLVSKRYVDDLISSLNIETHYENKIVYVDSNYGSDLTGEILRRDLPFLTIGSASQAISTIGGLVYLKSGIYNEMCVLTDGLKYYCEPGVIFESGGFTDYDLNVNCDIYGFAKFVGDSILLKPLTINNQSNINFEFDEITMMNSYQAIIINNCVSANIKGNRIKSSGVRTLRLKGDGNININISEDIVGANMAVYFETYTGNCTINSNNIITKSDVYDTSVIYGVNTNNGVTGKVIINSNIKNLGTYTTTQKTNSAVRISSGYFTINGNISGGPEYSTIITGNSLGQVTINGNLDSSVEALFNDTTKISLKLNSPLIITSGLSATYSMIFNGQSDTYILNTNIVNLTNDSNIIWVGNTFSQIKLYNSGAWSEGTSGYFIDSSSDLNVGIHNTRSNKDNNILVDDLFSPSGFIYDSNFYLPIF